MHTHTSNHDSFVKEQTERKADLYALIEQSFEVYYSNKIVKYCSSAYSMEHLAMPLAITTQPVPEMLHTL